MEAQYISKPSKEGFIVIGAGLPRTGTNSLRIALSHLLNGPVHHMYYVIGIRGEAANPTICYVLSHSWLLIWELEIRGIFR